MHACMHACLDFVFPPQRHATTSHVMMKLAILDARRGSLDKSMLVGALNMISGPILPAVVHRSRQTING